MTEAAAGKDLDLVAIGDLIIDFTCLGEGDSGMLAYERNPGGAPMNVAAQLARLGGRAGVVACVGDDEHGRLLRETMAGLGVDTANIQTCTHSGTRILFVYFRDGSDRYFSDYRGPRADLEILPERVDYDRIARSRVLLLSPLCNRYDKPIFAASQRALEVAGRNGALLAFDANFRFPYEDDRLRELDLASIRAAQILKMTSEEFAYYLEEPDIMRGTETLLAGNARLVAVSMGREGCFLRTRHARAGRPAFAVPSVDTTGAGDSFMGALLYRLTRPGVEIERLDDAALSELADFANACAGASTMRRGSLLVMPDRDAAMAILGGSPGAEPARDPKRPEAGEAEDG